MIPKGRNVNLGALAIVAVAGGRYGESIRAHVAVREDLVGLGEGGYDFQILCVPEPVNSPLFYPKLEMGMANLSSLSSEVWARMRWCLE